MTPRDQAIEEAARVLYPKGDGDCECVNCQIARKDAAAVIDAYEQARARLDGAKMMPDKPLTHQHVKRGTRYRIIGEAKLQTAFPMSDDTPLLIYQGEDGKLWARPPHEFNDGRFRATPKEGT